MAMNALIAVFKIFENYDDMVLIRDLKDEGSDRLIYFLSLYPIYL